MSFDLSAIEKAIRRVLVTASGLGDAQVLASNQSARPADGAYITMKTDGPFNIGGPKGETATYDGAAPLGQELTLAVAGPGELMLSLQSFAPTRGGGGEAQALLAQVQGALQLSSARAALKAAGVVMFDFGRVMSVPKVYGVDFEGRATLDVRCYVQHSAEEKVGYIATVEPAHGPWIAAEWLLQVQVINDSPPYTLPAGSIVLNDVGLRFVTLAEAAGLMPGPSTGVAVRAVDEGPGYNLAPTSIEGWESDLSVVGSAQTVVGTTWS